MDKYLTEVPPATITQDNELIMASYRLTTLEKRLLLIGMSKLNPMDFPSKGQAQKTLKLTADDWKQAFPDDPKPYRSLRAATDGMMNRQWRVDRPDGTYVKHQWVERSTYDPNRGEVELVFTNDTALRLHGMSGNFTSFELQQIGQLTSFNQIRLYEMLSRFKDTGKLIIKLDALRDALQLSEKHGRWSIFKRDALDPAIKLINKQTDMTVVYETTKAMRKIDGLIFHIRMDKQQSLNLD